LRVHSGSTGNLSREVPGSLDTDSQISGSRLSADRLNSE
jgi:hypothetical protein